MPTVTCNFGDQEKGKQSTGATLTRIVPPPRGPLLPSKQNKSKTQSNKAVLQESMAAEYSSTDDIFGMAGSVKKVKVVPSPKNLKVPRREKVSQRFSC